MAMIFTTLSTPLYRSRNHSLKQVGFCILNSTGDAESQAYRYMFNGMEADPELKGNGNSYTTEFRQYDPRLGRWLSLNLLMINNF